MVGGFVGCIKFRRRNSRGRFETRLGRQDPVSELVLLLLLVTAVAADDGELLASENGPMQSRQNGMWGQRRRCDGGIDAGRRRRRAV